MPNKYGIYQTSSNSCIFYKQDEDGNQSTFNLFISKNKQDLNKKSIFAHIDNEHMKQENWTSDDAEVEDIVEKFGGWASDAPLLFELEAQKSMGQCLKTKMNENND